MTTKKADNARKRVTSLHDNFEDWRTTLNDDDVLEIVARWEGRYSANNALLITMQRPEATDVHGYREWQTKFHRSVNHGETGIKIFAPAGRQVTEDAEEVRVRQFFRIAYVFDVAQTHDMSEDEIHELDDSEIF